MSRVSLVGQIVVPIEELNIVLEHLPRHIELTRQEAGCLKFEVVQNPQQPTVFSVSELFESEQAFELHQQRVKNSEWGMVTKNVERHYTIHTVS